MSSLTASGLIWLFAFKWFNQWNPSAIKPRGPLSRKRSKVTFKECGNFDAAVCDLRRYETKCILPLWRQLVFHFWIFYRSQFTKIESINRIDDVIVFKIVIQLLESAISQTRKFKIYDIQNFYQMNWRKLFWFISLDKLESVEIFDKNRRNENFDWLNWENKPTLFS